MPDERILQPTGQTAYGGAPYGDGAEITGPPQPNIVNDIPREFLGTDARSVMVVMYPNHWNFIPNPSCRVDDSGWEVNGVVHTLNPDISWLGQSLAIPQGSASIRYRDLDSNSDPAFVYVGPGGEVQEDLDYYEMFRGGRGSPQWRFSAYFRGTGRVRLTMVAYASSDPSVYKAPPRDAGAVTGDPESAPFDPNVPSMIDSGTGRLWRLKDPAWYRKIGWVSLSADNPADITADYFLPPELLQAGDPVPDVYTVTSQTAPFYSLWGTAPSVADPATTDPNTTGGSVYLHSSTDGSMWKLRESYLPHDPDPENPSGVPTYHYYIPNSIKVVEDAINYEPDLSKIDRYLEHSGSLYERNGSDATPYYDLVSPIIDAPISDLTDKTQLPEGQLPPTTGTVVRRTGAEGDGSIWIVKGPPWYTDTDRIGAGLASVSTQWITLRDPERWERHSVITNTVTHPDGERISFAGCYWIDAIIEVESDGPDDLLVSSVQLDPDETVEAQYFDGDLSEESGRNDYLWLGSANDSPSVYYYDREIRTKWIQENLRYLVPINRPYQIFYESTYAAYVPETNVIRTDSHGPSGMSM